MNIAPRAPAIESRSFRVDEIAPLFAVFAALDKDAARQAWRDRFNNRRANPRSDAFAAAYASAYAAARALGEANAGAIATAAARAAAEAVAAPAARLVVRADGDTTEILLHDEIGFFGITSKAFIEQLAAVTTPKIVVRINSPGGEVFDGLAIYEAIRADKRQIDVKVDGLAASAASFIAMAGRTVSMAPSSMLMVHDAWGITIGNNNDHLEMAATLDKIDGQIAGIYARKSGKDAKEFRDLMDAETFLDADESKALGLVDEIIDEASDDEAQDKIVPLTASETARFQAMRRRLAIEERDAA